MDRVGGPHERYPEPLVHRIGVPESPPPPQPAFPRTVPPPPMDSPPRQRAPVRHPLGKFPLRALISPLLFLPHPPIPRPIPPDPHREEHGQGRIAPPMLSLEPDGEDAYFENRGDPPLREETVVDHAVHGRGGRIGEEACNCRVAG